MTKKKSKSILNIFIHIAFANIFNYDEVNTDLYLC